MIRSFAELKEETRGKIARKSVPKMGVIFPQGGKAVRAAFLAHKDGFIIPTLIGNTRELRRRISDSNIDYDNFEHIEAASLEEAVKIGIQKARAGELDFLLKGSFPMVDLVDILKNSEIGFAEKGQSVSHIGLVQTDKYHKLMLITDAAYNLLSEANAKIMVARNAGRLARRLGNDSPRTALLAAVEAIYPAVPVTMEEAAIAKMSDSGQIKDIDIDGPLSFDVAISREVAQLKGITRSRVAGDSDIFVGPTIETANGLYKAMVLYAKGSAAGIIYGGNVLIASNFAVDSIEDIRNSIVLGSFLSID